MEAQKNQKQYGNTTFDKTLRPVTRDVPPVRDAELERLCAVMRSKALNLEKVVEALDKFDAYAPRNHRPGWALVKDLTAGMHPMATNVFEDDRNITKAVDAVKNYHTLIDNKVINDRVKNKDLDTTIPSDTPTIDVNRWEFLDQILKGKPNGSALQTQLKACLNELKKCTNELTDIVKQILVRKGFTVSTKK
ncbi:hypothetical protein QFC19_002332 [Naganishia cerealis]|uniref:Uncharacterized protein n=1 Tax=Naganishia cerealis TaxID=610337 RepID=A0ACC2WBP6_9TREE|nr:hypothetical protein QFC19_002332 [Naganishia cerealis]